MSKTAKTPVLEKPEKQVKNACIFNPNTFELVELKWCGAKADVKVKDRDAIRKDSFVSEEIEEKFGTEFADLYDEMTGLLVAEIDIFRKHELVGIEAMVQDSQGKGQDKKGTFKFTGYIPGGKKGNAIKSGELEQNALSAAFLTLWARMENLIREILEYLIQKRDEREEAMRAEQTQLPLKGAKVA